MVLQEKDVEENVNKEVNQGDIKMAKSIDEAIWASRYKSQLAATPNSFFPNTVIGFMGEIFRVMIYVTIWNVAMLGLNKISENKGVFPPPITFGFEERR